MKEYELEAEFLHEFRRHGAECSYPPIVAAGANACMLHYRSNDAQLVDGDLVLIDAGCEFGMYASDVTRTFPVNGRFSEPQRELYEVVLDGEPGRHRESRRRQSLERSARCRRQRRDARLERARLARRPRAAARQVARLSAASSCTRPGTGSVSTSTTSATTRLPTTGGCSSPAWS